MLEIAIDIGGTFTDIVCLQDQQRLCLAKVPTTPYDLVQGVRQGVARVLALPDSQPGCGAFHPQHHHRHECHPGTEGSHHRILMTAGFEDVLEIGRQKRSQMYDLFLDPETPSFWPHAGSAWASVNGLMRRATSYNPSTRRRWSRPSPPCDSSTGAVGGGLLPLLVYQPSARAAHSRTHRAKLPRPDRVAVVGDRSGLPGVRARLCHCL